MDIQTKRKTNIEQLFQDAKHRRSYVKICAPMVRYSKVEFRSLVRKYGVDLCFTPMIMADSFCQSAKARLSEFATNVDDTPLIAQFAANTTQDLLSGAEMVYPYVDGVDLNCGCPQGWAMESGYGSALLKDPELIKDMASTIRRNMPNSFSVSVKIRVQKPLSQTIELSRQLEKAGVTFLTVHGRTPSQGSKGLSDADLLKEVRQSISIPFVANGDCKSLSDANAMYEKVNCDGVMAARGILANPTLFSGEFETTPMECVQEWLNIVHAAGNRIVFQVFHHHLTFMMEKIFKRRDRVIFNNFTRKEQVFQFLADNYDLIPQPLHDTRENIVCDFDETKYRERSRSLQIERNSSTDYNPEQSKGKYFLSQSNLDDDDDVSEDLSNLFDT